MKLQRGNDVTAFSLDGLHKDGGHFLGGHDGFEKGFFNPADTLDPAIGMADPVRTTVTVGVGYVGDTRHQGIIMLFLDRFAGRKGQGPHGSTVKGPEKGDVQFPFGMPSGQLEGRLHGLGPGVAEKDLLWAVPRAQGSQLFGQKDLGSIIKVGPGHVDEKIGLFFDGLNHFRMAVAGGTNSDAGGKIEKDVPIHILDPKPFSLS